MLVIILAAALFTFRGYIQRALQGQYRKAGESFGFLRQYNPGASTDCAFDTWSSNATGTPREVNAWYSQACFNNKSVRCNLNAQYDDCLGDVRLSCQQGCAS